MNEYQGWTNAETFHVSHWIDNSASALRHALKLSASSASTEPQAWADDDDSEEHYQALIHCSDCGRPLNGEDYTDTYDGQACKDCNAERGEMLRRWIMDSKRPILNAPYGILLTNALGVVNWSELAEHYAQKVAEGVTA